MGSIERYLDLEIGVLCVVSTSSDFVTHSHDEATLTFSIGGYPGKVASKGQALRLGTDVGLALNAHRQHSHSLGGIEGRFLCIKIDSELVRARWPQSRGGRLLFASPAVPIDQDVAALLDGLSAPDLAVGDAERGAAALLERAVAQRAENDEVSGWRGAADFRLRRAMNFMGENAARPHDLHAAAAAAGLSRARFCKLFKEQVGTTPAVFWNMLRIAQVVGELASGPSSLDGVAQRFGFASAANFLRFFRDRIGVSPSIFRAAACSSSSDVPRTRAEVDTPSGIFAKSPADQPVDGEIRWCHGASGRQASEHDRS